MQCTHDHYSNACEQFVSVQLLWERATLSASREGACWPILSYAGE